MVTWHLGLTNIDVSVTGDADFVLIKKNIKFKLFRGKAGGSPGERSSSCRLGSAAC